MGERWRGSCSPDEPAVPLLLPLKKPPPRRIMVGEDLLALGARSEDERLEQLGWIRYVMTWSFVGVRNQST